MKNTKIIKFSENNSIALVSDAGMPHMRPGRSIAKEAKSKGINIICILGPAPQRQRWFQAAFHLLNLFYWFSSKKENERDKILYETNLCEYTTIS